MKSPKEFSRLPEAELELMLLIWQAKEPITSDYLMNRLEGMKTWSKTTVLNFLTRLVNRNFLSCEKDGRLNVYTPLVREQDYLEQESKSFLDRMYQSSIKNMVASLYENDGITKADLEELKRFIEEAE